jgi:hypothetical protein
MEPDKIVKVTCTWAQRLVELECNAFGGLPYLFVWGLIVWLSLRILAACQTYLGVGSAFG